MDYVVQGPDRRVILEASKERQGDFVFSAKEPGEYSFCFDNDMSTFAEKVVDFEITVCLLRFPFLSLSHHAYLLGSTNLMCCPFSFPFSIRSAFALYAHYEGYPGRKRSSRPAAEQTRHLSRTDFGPGRIHLQSVRAAVDHQPKPEILPHAREPQLQHGQEHGEPDLPIQRGRERADGLYGRVAGLYRAVLFPGS